MRHDGVVDSMLGFGSRHPIPKPGRVSCVGILSPHSVTAVGKMLGLTCLGGDCPSFTVIIHTLLSSDCGMSVVSNKQIVLLLLIISCHSVPLVNGPTWWGLSCIDCPETLHWEII